MSSTVSGTGTSAKIFSQSLNLPGSGRADGKTYKVRATGYVHQNGSGGTVQLALNFAHAPGSTEAWITATSLTSNVATYTCQNDYVQGQLVTVTGCQNGVVVSPPTASPFNVTRAAIASASSSEFTVAITHDDIPADDEMGYSPTVVPWAKASIASSAIFTSTARAVTKGNYAPWVIEAEIQCDSNSGIMQGMASAQINKLLDEEAALAFAPTGLDLASEPAGVFEVAVTFDSSDAANRAVLKEFSFVS